MTLKEIREILGVTQADAGRKLGIGKTMIDWAENQKDDLRVSTLRKYVEALGGELRVVARFPDQDFLITLGENE